MRQEEKRNRVEQAVRSFYEEKAVAPHLVESVLYSIQAGGKRLRPLLLLDPFGMIAASALPDAVKVSLILELSDASGSRGMVAGQVLDMEGEHKQLTLAELKTIHANKTGRLLAYPFIAAGLILELQADIGQLLEKIGKKLGLAFQVRDDILDLVADFEALGKTPQKDLVAEKSTYPALLGLEESKALLTSELNACEDLLDQITAACDFDPQAIKKLIEGLRIDG